MIPYEFDAERFSRWMAYVLRHNPTRYGLTPDRHGYVDLKQFLALAKRRYQTFVSEEFQQIIESSGSGRFEVSGNRLRARYGHSIPVEPLGPPIEPPARLYHGTQAAYTATISAEGLNPVHRRFLHLSETVQDALAIAQRSSDQPAVWCVFAREAHENGTSFYREGKVYLAACLAALFLKLEELPGPTEVAPSHPLAGQLDGEVNE